MKRLSLLFLVIGLILSSYAFASAEMKWYSLKEGMAMSKTEKKPVIVDFFYGKGCPRCEFLQKEVYDNPSIAKKIMDDFIPIRVDLMKKLSKEEEELGNKYKFKNDCLLIFLDPQENLVEDPFGQKLCFIDKVEPGEFIKYLDMIKGRYGKP